MWHILSFAEALLISWSSAARGIVVLRVDKFPYPRQQARGN